MAYLGKTPSQAVRSRYYFTASGGETSLSPSEVTSLSFTDANYVDVSLNGVALVSGTDYTATPSTNTISGLAALTASDVVEIVVYDTFSVFGGNVNGDFNISGGDLTLGDNDKAIFGAGSDLQIYHDGTHSYISDATGTGNLYLQSSSYLVLETGNGNENYLVAQENGPVTLYYDSAAKLATTSSGIDVTGTVTADGLTVDSSGGGLTFSGGGSTFISATSSPLIFQTSSGTERMRITGTGNVGIGTASPDNVNGLTKGGTHLMVNNDSGGARLNVEGSTDARLHMVDTGASANQKTYLTKVDGGNYTISLENDAGTASERLRIDSSGKVAIGTTSTAAGQFTIQSSGNQQLVVTDDGSEKFSMKVSGNDMTLEAGSGGSNSTNLIFKTASSGTESEAMRIDSSGNVGIGTDSPGDAQLYVEGGQVIARHDHTTTSLSGNTNLTGFPHSLSVYNGNGTGTTNLASIGFSIDTTGAVTNGAIVGHSTAAGSMDLAFYTESSNAIGERMRIDSSGNVGISNSSPQQPLHVGGSVGVQVNQLVRWIADNNTLYASVAGDSSSNLIFYTGSANTERVRIDSSGSVMFQTTDHDGGVSTSSGQPQFSFRSVDGLRASTSGTHYFNKFNDGTIIIFRGQGTDEGNISISGTTISYNGGHLARWSQATDGNRIDGLVKGTVMTNLDQMAVWHHEAQPATYYEEGDELPEGVSVGDEKTPAVAAYDEDNEQLNCMAVSSVEGDANVAGVFVNWDDDDTDFTADMNIAMTGDMVIRIAQGTTVARGDLLMSAGDGTAKPQGDDIVRSKTIAKVTSTTVSHTYDDGSYLVPCVLMAC